MVFHKEKIGLLFLTLYFLSLAALLAAFVRQTGPSVPPVEKGLHVGYACWPYYDLESAAAEADTIVYGEVKSKGDTKSHEIGRSSHTGKVFLEYYREVEVRVITTVKGDPAAPSVIYIEPGGETADTIYKISGVEEVEEGETYLFFLNGRGSFLSPATLLKVEDGLVTPSPDMSPEGEGQTPHAIPLDGYLEIVKGLL